MRARCLIGLAVVLGLVGAVTGACDDGGESCNDETERAYCLDSERVRICEEGRWEVEVCDDRCAWRGDGAWLGDDGRCEWVPVDNSFHCQCYDR